MMDVCIYVRCINPVFIHLSILIPGLLLEDELHAFASIYENIYFAFKFCIMELSSGFGFSTWNLPGVWKVTT